MTPNERTTKYLRRSNKYFVLIFHPCLLTYLSQERHASVSQACREFVERIAGRKRHRKMQGREERESEEDFMVVVVVEEEEGEENKDMADMKYGILATRYKRQLGEESAA